MINKCDNCDEEYEMHSGSNICPKCGERTFISAKETNGKQQLILKDIDSDIK